MNYDQFTGIVRAVVPALVGLFAGQMTSETSALVVTAVIAVCMAAWSILNNKTGKTIG